MHGFVQLNLHQELGLSEYAIEQQHAKSSIKGKNKTLFILLKTQMYIPGAHSPGDR